MGALHDIELLASLRRALYVSRTGCSFYLLRDKIFMGALTRLKLRDLEQARHASGQSCSIVSLTTVSFSARHTPLVRRHLSSWSSWNCGIRVEALRDILREQIQIVCCVAL